MTGFSLQLLTTLRLHGRNRMALLYGYLFPTLFLLAFRVLYRYESPVLVRHLGEILTVTALGGACFGLPTSLVSERERGVWRRYRLAPISTAGLLASTLAARYLLLLTAGLLQIALAMALGMPPPAHPLALFVAFTFVCFAFLALGLVIAALADSVPAVQALGQCIFLPMLIIGGVAVRLASLPAWAQHLSAFFPGRHAVEALQGATSGEGAGGAALLALALIGAAGSLAGTKLFRWDSGQRFAAATGKGWVLLSLAGWVAAGALAEARGQVTAAGGTASVSAAPRQPADRDSAPPPGGDPTPASSAAPPGPGVGASPAAPVPARARAWEGVTAAQVDGLDFAALPDDEGIVAPVATVNDPLLPEWEIKIGCMRTMLPQWGPGADPDPVQRVRNYLSVAAVPDVLQLEGERWIPLAVFERLEEDIPRDDLVKILYWIATHPAEGDLSAIQQVAGVCLDTGAPSDLAQVRERVGFYAMKLLGRLTGRLQQR